MIDPDYIFMHENMTFPCTKKKVLPIKFRGGFLRQKNVHGKLDTVLFHPITILGPNFILVHINIISMHGNFIFSHKKEISILEIFVPRFFHA